MSYISQRKIEIMQATLNMSQSEFWTKVGSSKASGARFLGKETIPLKYEAAFQTLERRAVELLRDEFGIRGARGWRNVPYRIANPFGLLESTDIEVATDCTDEKAFAIEAQSECMEPQIRRGSILVISPSTVISNGQIGFGVLKQGGPVIGIYTRIRGVRLKFILKPTNSIFLHQQFEEKDFSSGIWPIFGTYTKYLS